MCIITIIEFLDAHTSRYHLHHYARSHDLMGGNLIKLEQVLNHLLFLSLDNFLLSRNTNHC